MTRHSTLLLGGAATAAVAAAALAAGSGASTPGTAGQIAYSKEIKGHYQLFTINADGSDERQITHLPGDSVAADWSPDGKRIVFEYDRPHDKGCALMLVDAD